MSNKFRSVLILLHLCLLTAMSGCAQSDPEPDNYSKNAIRDLDSSIDTAAKRQRAQAPSPEVAMQRLLDAVRGKFELQQRASAHASEEKEFEEARRAADTARKNFAEEAAKACRSDGDLVADFETARIARSEFDRTRQLLSELRPAKEARDESLRELKEFLNSGKMDGHIADSYWDLKVAFDNAMPGATGQEVFTAVRDCMTAFVRSKTAPSNSLMTLAIQDYETALERFIKLEKDVDAVKNELRTLEREVHKAECAYEVELFSNCLQLPADDPGANYKVLRQLGREAERLKEQLLQCEARSFTVEEELWAMKNECTNMFRPSEFYTAFEKVIILSRTAPDRF